MAEKHFLYNAKTKESREICLIGNIWVYADDKSLVPDRRLKGFHTNGLKEAEQVLTHCS